MTPREYFFDKQPDACNAAWDFCEPFDTMRDAWLSPDVDVSHMCWALGRDEANRDGLVNFALWCAERASATAANGYARECAIATCGYATVAAKRSTAIDHVGGQASEAADSAADGYDYDTETGVTYDQMRAKLRELFPDMFVEPQGVPNGPVA